VTASTTHRLPFVVGQPDPTIQTPGRVSGETARAQGSSLGTVIQAKPAGAVPIPHSVTPDPQVREARPRPKPAVTETITAVHSRKIPGETAQQIFEKPHAMDKPIAVEKFQGKSAEGGVKIKEGKAAMGVVEK